MALVMIQQARLDNGKASNLPQCTTDVAKPVEPKAVANESLRPLVG